MQLSHELNLKDTLTCKMYLRDFFVYLTTLFIAINQCNAIDHCVMYSKCGIDETTGLALNCFTSSPAKHLNDSQAVDTLSSLCPSLQLDKHNNFTCCDAEQVTTFKGQLDALAALFSRCPSCYYNLANIFCEMVCSANQNTFLDVTKKQNISGKVCVTELSYYLTETYSTGLFDSCKDVKMSNSPVTAMSISCGGADPCTPRAWLDFMGGHDPSPFQINFQLIGNGSTPIGYTPMNDTYTRCNEAPNKHSAGCGCMDCPCTPTPPPPLDCPFLIFDVPGMYIIMLGIFIFVYITVIVGFTIKYCRRARPAEDDDECLLTMDDDKKEDKMNVLTRWENFGEALEIKLQLIFTNWGRICATYPFVVLFVGFAFVLIASCGLFFFTVQANPVELWSASNSEVREEKSYFDQHFNPFYRTEQLIITRVNGTPVYGTKWNASDVFDRDFLKKILAMQNDIVALTAEINNKTIRFEEICFSPLSNGKCMIQSVVNWFQNNLTNLLYYSNDDYLQYLKNCTNNPMYIQKKGLSCLGEYGGPVFPYVALGGVGDGNYLNASALIVTFMVNNHVKDVDNAAAIAWERKFLEYVQNFSDPDMNIAYSAERSIQDELDRESRSDITTILISYMVMFAYVSITLGQYHSPKLLLVKSKILLGLGGVLIVLASVVTSLGIFSYIGVPSTLIIVEVIPFLVLAVGVDNIFIMVQTFYRNPKHDLESREEHIGRVFGQIAPSLLLASLSESSCFFLGSLSGMPAVHLFAFYSGLALIIDFLLQITCFLALLSLDIKREEQGRYEILCCVKSGNIGANKKKQHGFLYRVFEKFYAPFLMKSPVRASVLILFGGWLCSSIAVLNQIEIGLDQKLSMPEDSYVLKYFGSLEKYLSVGPPVYFVVKSGLKYSDFDQQNALCSGIYCYRDALPTQLLDASYFANRTYIAYQPMNWLDSYFGWVGDETGCCRVYKTNHTAFCPPTENQTNCMPCNVVDEETLRPKKGQFYTYFIDFLEMNPTPDCPVGGHAAFADALELKTGNVSEIIGASHFMTYHTILKTSADYIGALKFARNISKTITDSFVKYGIKDVEIFPYSIFYVFYEQYLTVIHDTIKSIIVSLVDIFIVTLLLMALDIHSSLILVLTILSITLNLMGLMYWWNISLNAVSLVNLVMSVGISVEFCSHITRAFALRSHGNRVQRAQYALAHMGSSVLSGITLTKFGGILVLAFSKSMIFRVFYFRMYLGIVIIGASHGLIFLPVLLSVIGPPVRKIKKPQANENNGDGFVENSTTFSESNS